MTVNDNPNVVKAGAISSAMESRALPKWMCPRSRTGQLDCLNCLFSSNCETYAKTVKANKERPQW